MPQCLLWPGPDLSHLFVCSVLTGDVRWSARRVTRSDRPRHTSHFVTRHRSLIYFMAGIKVPKQRLVWANWLFVLQCWDVSVVNGWCEICLWMNFNLDKMTKSNCNLCKYLCIIPGLAVYRLRDVFNLQGVGSSLLTVGIICVISNKAELLDFSDSNNNPIVSRTQLTFQRWHHDMGTV